MGHPHTRRGDARGHRGGAVAGKDIIVVGGSAGAVEALRLLVEGLPADLGASVLVVIEKWQSY
jgi:chemotaxis response regulator CheB